MKSALFYPAAALGLGLALSACAGSAESTHPPVVQTSKVVCSAPPPIKDIWALEPSLKRQGKIDDSMSPEQKETVIRAYIRERNQIFIKCKEGK